MATKEQKQHVVDELSTILQSSGSVYMANYKGMSVADINKLRNEFRKVGLTFKVYKNTLVRRAMEQKGGYDSAYVHLAEPTAYVFVGDDNPSQPAKVLKSFLKDNKRPAFKGAIIDGSFYGPENLDALSEFKSKNDVIGDIMGLLLSPMSNIVGALQSQGSNLVGAIKTIADKEQ
jgi:large subunit ribosomal protein L10